MDARLQPVFAAVMLLVLWCGCARDEKNPPANGGTETGKTAEADPGTQPSPLTGTWYGRAWLDTNLLNLQIGRTADPNLRQSMESIARTFLTTEIGARFDASGEMELDVQIQPAGEMALRDSTTGRWRVLEQDADSVLVETVETLPGGGTETNQVRYRFLEEGRYATMPAPTSELLAGCQPQFIFERVNTTSQVARQPGETGVR
jgi:hypothetical protein